MKDYDVNVFVHIVGHNIVLGTLVNVQELSRDRHALIYRNQVSIKVNKCLVLDSMDAGDVDFCFGLTICVLFFANPRRTWRLPCSAALT
jgi:hypothetical protein